MPEKPEPLWDGPCNPGPRGGITQSLLSRFLVCRERFRVRVIDGYAPVPQFQHRLEYGNMWHVCEESYLNSGNPIIENPVVEPPWARALKAYADGLCKKYPMQQKDIMHWCTVCLIQFPLYLKFWKQHPDMLNRTPLLQEKEFHEAYELPSGRVVWLRGKFDSVDLVQDKTKGKSGKSGIWLQENKSKGDINQVALQRQLNFDLQTMIYLVALYEYDLANLGNEALDEYVSKNGASGIIRGVRYNVVRRPLSGGAGSIRQHKPTKSNPAGESDHAFYQRVRGVIMESQESYFMRWNATITRTDVERFKIQFLNPCLEQLCDWWEWVSRERDPFVYFGSNDGKSLPYCFPAVHYRLPYGVYNPLLEGGFSEVDEYLMTGSTVGLHRADTLFPELPSSSGTT
jgi:hypothetical protein